MHITYCFRKLNATFHLVFSSIFDDDDDNDNNEKSKIHTIPISNRYFPRNFFPILFQFPEFFSKFIVNSANNNVFSSTELRMNNNNNGK